MLWAAMAVSTFDLRLFAAVIDQGGMAAAARKLGREKSTVSRDIAALEERLGVRLLNRTTRKVTPTEAGEVFLEHARRVAEEIEQVEAAIEALSDEPRGLLRVTAPYAIIRFVLAPRMKALLDRYRELRVAFEATTDVLDLVERGIDAAIRIGRLPDSSLVARKLGVSYLGLFASKSYIRRAGPCASLGDLTKHRLIDLSPQPQKFWRLTGEAGDVRQIDIAPIASVADPGMALDLAANGLGIAVAPDIYVTQYTGFGHLIRILPTWNLGIRPIHVLYPSRRQVTPKVQVFTDFALESMMQAMAQTSLTRQG